MKQNKGFSLVELIVVLAVMAVLCAAAVTGFGMVSGYRQKQCVKSIDGALNETMLEAMSRSACTLTISCNSDGVYYMEMTGKQKQKIASGSIKIAWEGKGLSGEELIGESNPLILSYDRSSGAFTPVIDTVLDVGAGSYSYRAVPGGSGYVYCSKLTVKMGSRVTTFKLEKDTGRHYIM